MTHKQTLLALRQAFAAMRKLIESNPKGAH